MTPKQVALVQDSFAKVALTSEAAAMLFYNPLFDIAPQMMAMFPDDMIEQRVGEKTGHSKRFEGNRK
jgi:hypothetical protein